MDKLEPIRRVFRQAGLYHHAADDLLCGELLRARIDAGPHYFDGVNPPAPVAAPPAALAVPADLHDAPPMPVHLVGMMPETAWELGWRALRTALSELAQQPAAAVRATVLGGELCGCGRPADYMANDGGWCCNKYGIRCKQAPPAAQSAMLAAAERKGGEP